MRYRIDTFTISSNGWIVVNETYKATNLKDTLKILRQLKGFHCRVTASNEKEFILPKVIKGDSESNAFHNAVISSLKDEFVHGGDRTSKKEDDWLEDFDPLVSFEKYLDSIIALRDEHQAYATYVDAFDFDPDELDVFDVPLFEFNLSTFKYLCEHRAKRYDNSGCTVYSFSDFSGARIDTLDNDVFFFTPKEMKEYYWDCMDIKPNKKKKKEPTKVMRVPESLVETVQKLIDDHKNNQ